MGHREGSVSQGNWWCALPQSNTIRWLRCIVQDSTHCFGTYATCFGRRLWFSHSGEYKGQDGSERESSNYSKEGSCEGKHSLPSSRFWDWSCKYSLDHRRDWRRRGRRTKLMLREVVMTMGTMMSHRRRKRRLWVSCIYFEIPLTIWNRTHRKYFMLTFTGTQTFKNSTLAGHALVLHVDPLTALWMNRANTFHSVTRW